MNALKHLLLHILFCFNLSSCIRFLPLVNASLFSSVSLCQARRHLLSVKLSLQSIIQAAAGSMPPSQRIAGTRTTFGQWAMGWAQLTDVARANLHTEALHVKAAEDFVTKQEIADLQHQLGLCQDRAAVASMQPVLCNKVSSLQHSQEHLARFEEIYAAQQGHGSYEEFGQIFGGPPVQLPDRLRRHTVELGMMYENKRQPLPPWIHHICVHREQFVGCASASGLFVDECSQAFVAHRRWD